MLHSWADDTVLERERDRERERCALIADAFGDAAAASAAAAAVQFGTDEMLWRCDLASAGMASSEQMKCYGGAIWPRPAWRALSPSASARAARRAGGIRRPCGICLKGK